MVYVPFRKTPESSLETPVADPDAGFSESSLTLENSIASCEVGFVEEGNVSPAIRGLLINPSYSLS